MAMESELVSADMVEVTEYPELSERYEVYGVPLTVVNDRYRIEGGMPEPYFVAQILQSVGIAVGVEEPEPQEGSTTSLGGGAHG
jgi:predicted DsbA family dithiol-disulfide isomerase